MGITNLESFLEEGEPNEYCWRVHLGDLAEQYRQRAGKTPVLVVDGSYFMQHFYYHHHVKRDFLCGGQLREFAAFARYFVNSLRVTLDCRVGVIWNLGLKLVFYFDGPTVKTKIDCRKRRNENKMHKRDKVFSNLGNNIMSQDMDKWGIIPVLVSAAGRFIFKYECECDVFVSVNECDEELAAYANRESCFAIMSQDTDFMCLKNAVYYLSIKRLNLNNMTTLLYDRSGLMRFFSLTPHQMRLYATLLGNEIVPLEKLKKFHKSICNASKPSTNGKCTKVADYVKERTQNCPNAVEDALPGILEHLHELDVDESLDEAIVTSLRSYLPSEPESWVTEKDIDEQWLEVLELAYKKHVLCEAMPDVYTTLLGRPYEIGMYLEDGDASRVFLPLRQRIYSVLLHERNAPRLVVEEFGTWGNKWHDPQPVDVPELPAGTQHPGLITLWTKDTQRVSRQRWALFASSISSKLDPAVFYKLNHHYVVPVAVLSYLKHEWKECDLEDWEIDAFIKQAVSVLALDIRQLESKKLANNSVSDKRVINLATLFGYGISMVLFLMSALGFPLRKAMPWFYFDGPLFHYNWHIGKQGKERVDNFSLNLPLNQVKSHIKEDFEIVKSILHPRNEPNHQKVTVNGNGGIEQ